MLLEPDQNQIELFVDALFRRAGAEGYISLRAFYEGTDNSFRITPISRRGNFQFLIEAVVDDYPFARRLPMMHRANWDGPMASSAIAFAWFVWSRDHKGTTLLQR